MGVLAKSGSQYDLRSVSNRGGKRIVVGWIGTGIIQQDVHRKGAGGRCLHAIDQLSQLVPGPWPLADPVKAVFVDRHNRHRTFWFQLSCDPERKVVSAG